MARIKRTAFSPDFTAIHQESQAACENNDCSVKAIALVTSRPYAEVHAYLAREGREKGKGTPLHYSELALKALGMTVRKWEVKEVIDMIRSYPPRAAGKRARTCITTHHWRRFPRAWAPHKGKKLIVVTATHMLAVIDGEVRDWSVNRALPVTQIWEI